MICKTCGETMVGDGYKEVIHCPNVADNQCAEPDANPIHCVPEDKHYTDAKGTQVRAKWDEKYKAWQVYVEGSARGMHANPDDTVPKIYRVKPVTHLSLNGNRDFAMQENAALYRATYGA